VIAFIILGKKNLPFPEPAIEVVAPPKKEEQTND
jgi:hypothetical protein